MKPNYGTELHPNRITIYVSGTESIELEFNRCSSTGDHIDIKIDDMSIWYPEEWDVVSAQIREAITYLMSYGIEHEDGMYITPEAKKRQKP